MDKDTSEYSASKAPETKAEAEERVSQPDSRLLPGGAEPRTSAPQGMAALDNAVPGEVDTGQTRYRDTSRDEVTGK